MGSGDAALHPEESHGRARRASSWEPGQEVKLNLQCVTRVFTESPGTVPGQGRSCERGLCNRAWVRAELDTCPRAAAGGKAARLGWLAALRTLQPTERRSRGRAGLGQAEWGRPSSPRWKPEDRAWPRAALSWCFWWLPEAGSCCRPVCPRSTGPGVRRREEGEEGSHPVAGPRVPGKRSWLSRIGLDQA